jgi:hypothetical protein
MSSHNEKAEELQMQKDIEFQEKIADELQPFLERILKSPKTDISLVKETLEKSFVPNKQLHELMESIFQAKTLIDEEQTLIQQIHELFTYLGLVESLATYYVDILVILVVASGRDFHIESMNDTPRINHAMSIEDLEESYTPLKTKLNFLKNNGLKLFVSTIDSNLRNDIAHFKIRIQNGKLLLRNKPIHEIIGPNESKIVNCINRTNMELFYLSCELDLVPSSGLPKTK